ncbi:TolC family protein [Thalassobellus suaedae]|uniref:TolC family protein n=1 Tax=Thalassobellus suaedae TaxID=3074124 RepID=A0ABY9XPM6_9FLAO|nr:TolC family protein [Flavobacteriaceae bacterium HL-DH14]
MKLNKTKILFLLAIILVTHTNYAQDSIPLNLESAIKLALDKNTDIIIANYQVYTSEFALKEAKGNFLPKLYASANYNRNINRQVIFLPTAFGMGGGVTELGADNDYRATLNLSVPIFSHFNNNNKKLIETRLNYQNESARNTRLNVINSIKKAYFNYLIAQEMVKVRQKQLKSAQETFIDIEKRKKLGTLTDYDFTTAKVQVAQAKNSLLEAQNTILPLANNLKLVLGLKKNDILKLTESVALLEHELVFEENPSELLSQNSTLKQLEIDIEVKKNQIKLAKSAFFPTLDAVGAYNYQAQEDGFHFSDYRWINTSFVGLKLQFSIFNGNITKNKLQQAKIAKDISEEQKEHTTEATKMQLQVLLSQLEFAKQKTEVQKENMNLTEEALRLTKKRYQLGVGTFLEVNNAELSYTQARLFWLQAISDYKSAYYDYQLVIGQY